MLKEVWLIVLVFWAFSNPATSAETPIMLASGTQMHEEPARIVLPDGTPVQLRITQRLSTATAKLGDRVEFEVVQDVRVSDFVVIPL